MSPLENILSSSMWTVVIALGTTLTALITYLTLRKLRRDRKAKINKEIKDKIYEVYFEDLRHIQNSVAVLTLGPTPLPDSASKFISLSLPVGTKADVPWLFSWETIKEKYPFLTKKAKIKRKVKKDIEELAQHCEKFKSSAITLKDSLAEVYEEEEIKEIPELNNLEWVQFNSRLGYKYCTSLLELIFLDKTFDQWWSDKVENNPYLSSENIDGKFQAESTKLDKQTFEKIYNAIKQRIEDSPDLAKFVEENRKIYKEAKSLEKSIRKIRDKLVLA